MAKIFYDHLIDLTEVLVELDSHPLKHDEKVGLIRTIDTTIHYHVMGVALSHLPKDKQQKFLQAFKKRPHDKKHLVYLKTHREDIEDDMRAAIRRVTTEILKDLKSSLTG